MPFRHLFQTAALGLAFSPVLLGAAVSVSPDAPPIPTAPAPAATSLPAPGGAARSIDPPSRPGALAPRWLLTERGPLLTWLEPWELSGEPGSKIQGHRLRLSRFEGERWSEPVTVAEGARFFANWADTPGAAEGPGGRLYAHWLEKSGSDPYDYGIQLATSGDGGATWKPIGPLNRDGAMGEHGFVSWARDGDWLRAFWVDGRDMSMKDGQQVGAMSLRSALVGEVAEGDIRLDGRICDCCQTAAAVTADGPVVVYRGRTQKEVRDIHLVRRTPSGWSEPVVAAADGWEIPGCPVNGPVVAASGRIVAVAWFTGGAPAVRVQVAFSQDGGATVGKPLVLDDGTPIGRVDLAFDADGSALVSWYAFAGEGAALQIRRAWPDGRLGPVTTHATTTPGRSSGFPRLLLEKGRIFLAWVDDGSPQRLRAATLPTSSIP